MERYAGRRVESSEPVTMGDRDMAAEIRHCERCDHEFEVEVSSARSGEKVEGCPETTADCGLTQPGEQVKVVREID